MRGHQRNKRHAISMFRRRLHCRFGKNMTRRLRRHASLLSLSKGEPIGMNAPIDGDDDPAALGRERVDPGTILSVGREAVGQVDDPIALWLKQGVESVGGIRRQVVVEERPSSREPVGGPLLEPHGRSHRLWRHLAKPGDLGGRALGGDRIGKHSGRQASGADDRLSEAAGGVEYNRGFAARAATTAPACRDPRSRSRQKGPAR